MLDTTKSMKMMQLNQFADKLGEGIFGDKWDKLYLKISADPPELEHRFNGDIRYFIKHDYIKYFLEENLHRPLTNHEQNIISNICNYTMFKIIPISNEAMSWFITKYNIIDRNELEIFKTIGTLEIENYKLDNARYISNLIYDSFVSGNITAYYVTEEEPHIKSISPYQIQAREVLFKFATGKVHLKKESLLFEYLTDGICFLELKEATHFNKKHVTIKEKLNKIKFIKRFKAIKNIFYLSFIKLYNEYVDLFNKGLDCFMPTNYDLWKDIRGNLDNYKDVIISMDRDELTWLNQYRVSKTVKFKSTYNYVSEFKQHHKIE